MNGVGWSGEAVEKMATIRKRRRRLDNADCLELRGEVFAELYHGPHHLDFDTISRIFGKHPETVRKDVRDFEARKRAEEARED